MLETLDYTIRIGSTLTFLYFDLYLYSASAYAAHYIYLLSEMLLSVYQLISLLDQDFGQRIQPVYSLPFTILFLISFVVKFFRYQWWPVLGDWIGIPRSPAPMSWFLQRMVTWISMNELLSKEHRVQECIWCPCSAIALPCTVFSFQIFCFLIEHVTLCVVCMESIAACVSYYSLGQKQFFMLCMSVPTSNSD